MADQKLSARQRRFVENYIRLGGQNATQAALAAGYGKSPEAAAVSAHRLLRRGYILQAIREETEHALRAQVALGADVLCELARKAESESVRYQAAQALLDRGGMRLANISEHHHIIEDRRTDRELLERIEQLSRELGIAAKPIDGEVIREPTPKREQPALEHAPDDAPQTVPDSAVIKDLFS